MTSKIRWTLFLAGGFFLLADRWLKYTALHNWQEKKLIADWLGWSPWTNSGAIFGLPIPAWMLLVFSAPLILLVLFMFIRLRQNFSLQFGLYLILLGAISNFFDRLIYYYTIDYFLIITGLINLADILIIGGMVWFLWLTYKQKKAGYPINF